MTLKQQVLARCKELGVEFLTCEDGFEVWSPAGIILCSTGCHCAVQAYRDPSWDKVVGGRVVHATAQDGYKAVLDDLSMGVEPCTQGATCDTCCPEAVG